jgi:CheY-like chemotaxis protein
MAFVSNQGERSGLSGLRVMVVEDSLLVADMIAELLMAAGVDVLGPFGRLDGAVAAADVASLDGALLDVNLDGELSFPIAEALQRRGIPFIFLTGYSDAGALPPPYRDSPRLVKPFRESELAAAVAARFRAAH